MRIRRDGRKYLSEDERQAMVRDYEGSGESLTTYSTRHGISCSVLNRAVQKYGTTKPGNNFMEILESSSVPVGETGRLYRVELELGNSIVLRIWQEVAFDYPTELIEEPSNN